MSEEIYTTPFPNPEPRVQLYEPCDGCLGARFRKAGIPAGRYAASLPEDPCPDCNGTGVSERSEFVRVSALRQLLGVWP